jgi:hypothetical protein
MRWKKRWDRLESWRATSSLRHLGRLIGRQGNEKQQRKLVQGTWCLVIVSLLALAVTAYFYSQQLVEVRKTTELAWRPFLHLREDTTKEALKVVRVWHNQLESTEKETQSGQEIPVCGERFSSIDKFVIEIEWNYVYSNIGRTPLVFTRSVVSALTVDQWVNQFDTSCEKLVTRIRQDNLLRQYRTDVPILPSDSFVPSGNPRKVSLEVEKLTLSRWATKDSRIVLYPFSYVEYTDFFGHTYDALLINHVVQKLQVDSCSARLIPMLTWGIERYRWDISKDR